MEAPPSSGGHSSRGTGLAPHARDGEHSESGTPTHGHAPHAHGRLPQGPNTRGMALAVGGGAPRAVARGAPPPTARRRAAAIRAVERDVVRPLAGAPVRHRFGAQPGRPPEARRGPLTLLR